MLFGLFSVPWDFFHIGLLVVVIMILISGMVVCVSVVGVCCLHWMEKQNPSQNCSEVVVQASGTRSKSQCEWVDPVSIRNHYEVILAPPPRTPVQNSHAENVEPPPSYEVLYPGR